MSARAVASDVARELASLVGEKNVSDAAAELQGFAIDGIVPRLSVHPGTPAEVAEVLRFCHANDLVVAPCGGGTAQAIGQTPAHVDVLLRTTRLKEVEHYDPGDLTIGIGAGTTIAELHARITPNRQVFPLLVPQAEQSTVGGVLARSAHDPRRLGYGAIRDFCIGIRFVTADGKIAKAGGRVVKNVAGYDLMKLMIGSYGTLSVIVGASFKLFPQPRQTRTFGAPFAALEAALAFRDSILKSQLSPMALELLSPEAQVLLGASLQGAESGWLVLLRAAGTDAVLDRYGRELGGAVVAQIEGTSEASLWERVTGFVPALLGQEPNAMLLRISVPIAATGAAVQAGTQNAA
ncbi:MAG: FAD-binding oxidoreductase, partial [Candidatus Korobacteraceae bacterium]